MQKHLNLPKDGFVKLSYVASDGQSGELLVDGDDPAALFDSLTNWLRFSGFMRKPNPNQLTLSLAEEQQKEHAFR